MNEGTGACLLEAARAGFLYRHHGTMPLHEKLGASAALRASFAADNTPGATAGLPSSAELSYAHVGKQGSVGCVGRRWE